MMKKLLIAFFILILAQTVSAQIRRKAPLPVNKNTDSLQMSGDTASANKMKQKEMLQQLDLTTEQKTKVKDILQVAKDKKETVQNDETLTEEQKTEKLREIKKEAASKIDAILTDEQRTKWKKLKQQQVKNSLDKKKLQEGEMKENKPMMVEE